MQESEEMTSTTFLLTIPQVAAYLGVSRAHVYRLIYQGLPVVKLGRLVRVHKVSLHTWIASQEHRSSLS